MAGCSYGEGRKRLLLTGAEPRREIAASQACKAFPKRSKGSALMHYYWCRRSREIEIGNASKLGGPTYTNNCSNALWPLRLAAGMRAELTVEREPVGVTGRDHPQHTGC